MTFADAIAGAEPLEGGFALSIPETWHQGRTAFGGFSSALTLVAAMRCGGAGLPPMRSAQFSMIAPVAGAAQVRARVLRAGRNATWAAAEITCGGAVAFTASFVFMGPVDSELHLNQRPVPAELVPVEQARAIGYTEHTPAFLRHHFTARHALPPAAGKQPDMCRWMRLVDGAGLDPMVEMLLIGDSLPPGVMPLLSARVPVSTMHWQVNLLTPAPQTRGGWWLLRSVGDYAEKGCSSQRMAIWNADGAPVMAGLQSVAVFG